ncbi:4f592476-50d1-4e43-978d-6e4e2d48e327 [Thermothielavioides terrestris]|jgi:hypothetical protein|uniref:4f592476-50d1-4e43-978d-6e4e2d48e327 n=1 Tax=Thermothielavioides terrestris TaxID=2587410 RepID=A0A3S4ARS2_9PEZI|nr:4f592476-50d1-4e43-978d-6e4e2d48e327 [Thermothielavioides terrestris]
MSKATTSEVWFRRAFDRLSMVTRRPKFREIHWHDDGEVRPVTRGKAKQFAASDAISPTAVSSGIPAYRMNSSLSYSSQVALIGDSATLVKRRKPDHDRSWYYVSLSRK